MRLLYHEFDKVFIKNKAFILVILAIALRVFLLTLESAEITHLKPSEEKVYRSIAQRFTGEVTEEEAEYLEGRYFVVSRIEGYIASLREQYQGGEISRSEYEKQMAIFEKLVRERDAFLKLFSQYRYASEEPEARAVIYATGWNGLLTQERFDWGFVLLVIVLSAMVFGREYDNGMRSLLISTSKGGKPLLTAKFLSILFLVVGLSVLSSFLELAYFEVNYGLPQGSYPLQSLPYFRDSAVNHTLQWTYLMIVLYRTFGYLLLMTLTIFLTVRLQKTILAMSIALMSVVLPYALPIVQSIKYLLPTPLGFILAQGFFRSSEVMEDFGIVLFRAISSSLQLLLIGVWMVVSFLMMLDSINQFASVGLIKQRLIKRLSMLVLVSFSVFFLVSCSGKNSTVIDNNQIYNSEVNTTFTVVEGQIVWLKDLLYSQNLNSGEIQKLIRDPFLTEEEINNQVVAVYENAGHLYYINKTNDKLQLVQLNLDNFKDKVIYQEKILTNPQLIQSGLFVYGEGWEGKKMTPFFLKGSTLFLTEQFVSTGLRSIYGISLKTGRKTLLIEKILGNIAYDGSRIFYINDMFEIRALDLESGKNVVFQDHRASDMLMFENKIYYRNIDEGGVLYSLDVDTGYSNLVFDQPLGNYLVDDGYLYYINPDDEMYLYRMDLDTGSNELVVPLGQGYWIQTHSNSPYIFLTILVIKNNKPDLSYLRIDKETLDYDIVDDFFSG